MHGRKNFSPKDEGELRSLGKMWTTKRMKHLKKTWMCVYMACVTGASTLRVRDKTGPPALPNHLDC